MPSDRDVLFANESFLIGVLQAVSGGSLVAAIAQFPALKAIAGLLAVLLFITFMTIALASAIVAAFCKHHYKMWDVKAGVSLNQGKQGEALDRSISTSRYLTVMRGAMAFALVSIVIALAVFVGACWIYAYHAA